MTQNTLVKTLLQQKQKVSVVTDKSGEAKSIIIKNAFIWGAGVTNSKGFQTNGDDYCTSILNPTQFNSYDGTYNPEKPYSLNIPLTLSKESFEALDAGCREILKNSKDQNTIASLSAATIRDIVVGELASADMEANKESYDKGERKVSYKYDKGFDEYRRIYISSQYGTTNDPLFSGDKISPNSFQAIIQAVKMEGLPAKFYIGGLEQVRKPDGSWDNPSRYNNITKEEYDNRFSNEFRTASIKDSELGVACFVDVELIPYIAKPWGKKKSSDTPKISIRPLMTIFRPHTPIDTSYSSVEGTAMLDDLSDDLLADDIWDA